MIGGTDEATRGLDLLGVQDMERLDTQSVLALRREAALDARLVPLPSLLPVQESAAAEDSWLRASRENLGAGDAILAPIAALPYVTFDICTYSWPCVEAERIIQCESNGDAGATSGVSWGLWQINAIHFWRWPNAWSEWMIPEVNTAWAYELYQEQGWSIWDCW